MQATTKTTPVQNGVQWEQIQQDIQALNTRITSIHDKTESVFSSTTQQLSTLKTQVFENEKGVNLNNRLAARFYTHTSEQSKINDDTMGSIQAVATILQGLEEDLNITKKQGQEYIDDKCSVLTESVLELAAIHDQHYEKTLEKEGETKEVILGLCGSMKKGFEEQTVHINHTRSLLADHVNSTRYEIGTVKHLANETSQRVTRNTNMLIDHNAHINALNDTHSNIANNQVRIVTVFKELQKSAIENKQEIDELKTAIVENENRRIEQKIKKAHDILDKQVADNAARVSNMVLAGIIVLGIPTLTVAFYPLVNIAERRDVPFYIRDAMQIHLHQAKEVYDTIQQEYLKTGSYKHAFKDDLKEGFVDKAVELLWLSSHSFASKLDFNKLKKYVPEEFSFAEAMHIINNNK